MTDAGIAGGLLTATVLLALHGPQPPALHACTRTPPPSVTIDVRSFDTTERGQKEWTMTKYSAGLKEQMVRKLMPPSNRSVTAVSRETGISAPSLYAWKKQFRDQGHLMPKKPGPPDQWDSKAKLAALIHTSLMSEAERSAYCREHGLYVEQLDAWKGAFEAMDATDPTERTALARERQKSRELARELQRKEKALAEAAALLTLSKKARAIWGTDADD